VRLLCGDNVGLFCGDEVRFCDDIIGRDITSDVGRDNGDSIVGVKKVI